MRQNYIHSFHKRFEYDLYYSLIHLMLNINKPHLKGEIVIENTRWQWMKKNYILSNLHRVT